MPFFTEALCAQLLLGQHGSGDVGFVAAVLPKPLPASGAQFDLDQVLASTTLSASIVFLQAPVPDDAPGQQAFADAVLGAASGVRCLLWTGSAAAFEVVVLVPIAGNGQQTTGPLALSIGPTLSVTLSAGAGLSATGARLAINMSNAQMAFGGPSGWPLTGAVFDVGIPVSGPHGGCLAFTTFIPQTTLASLNLGFCFGAPSALPSKKRDVSRPLLLLAPLLIADASSQPQFSVMLDPLDPFNGAHAERTVLRFTGSDLDRSPTVLVSTYVTTAGNDSIVLTPVFAPQTGQVDACLVFQYAPTTLSDASFLSLAPEGDFVISLASGGTASVRLLCGLQGAEYLVVHPGDRMRFTSGQAAYAPDFPFPLASPTAAPPSSALPLTTAWTTSYLALLPAGAPVVSVAQPPGLNLYGNDTLVHAGFPNLLGHVDPGQVIAAVPVQSYPMVPYWGVVSSNDGRHQFDADQIAAFETQILAPLRRRALAADSTGARLSAQGRLAQRPLMDDGAPAAVTFTTPNGFLVAAGEDAATPAWQQILLASLLDSGQNLGFGDPTPALTEAFQSGALMLVFANAAPLGSQAPGNGATFANTLTIGDWIMSADVGSASRFGDYANILIIKGVAGALYDPSLPAHENLLANPAKWTMAEQFAAPATIAPGQTDPGPPDPSQMVNLAMWLQQYFAAAAVQPDRAYFATFNTIAKDVNWTGVLVLRGDISGLPEGLAGIAAGVTDLSDFKVHHLAIPVTPVKNGAGGPVIAQSSAVSGLIYYLDPQADPAAPATPLADEGAGAYDFRLLSLKVAFENSAVKSFASYAQITLTSLLGMSVVGMGGAGNAVDAIVLTGSYQLIANQPVYSMASVGDSVFLLGNNVLPQLDITGVQMATVSADPAGVTESVFAMSGTLDFAILAGAAPTPENYDLFSFGAGAAPTQANAGLAFANLALRMCFPTAQPAARTFALDASAIRFDLGTSNVRAGSFVNQLALQLTGLVTGASDTPAARGYLPVIATMIRPGNLGTSWNALKFRLNLGTPGALAGAVGFNATLLLAWSTSPGAVAVQVGLSLPGTAQGAPLISLQNVLKLSVGQVRLVYDPDAKAYQLLLDEIALKFLGLLKIPPNGNTTFYLFGDPAGGAENGVGWYAMYAQDAKTGQMESIDDKEQE